MAKITVNSKEVFTQNFNNSWSFLLREFTETEMKVTLALSLLAHRSNNSLDPLSDKTTIEILTKVLNISKNTVTPIMEKLKHYGVYGTINITGRDGKLIFWTLNPFLSYRGRVIDKYVAKMFQTTHIGYAYNDPDYSYMPRISNQKIPDFSLTIDY